MPIRSSPPPVTSLTHPHVVAFGSTPIAHADTEVGRTARLATASPLLCSIFKFAASPPSLFRPKELASLSLAQSVATQHLSPPLIREWGGPRGLPPQLPFFIPSSRSRLRRLPFSTKELASLSLAQSVATLSSALSWSNTHRPRGYGCGEGRAARRR